MAEPDTDTEMIEVPCAECGELTPIARHTYETHIENHPIRRVICGDCSPNIDWTRDGHPIPSDDE